MVERKCQVSGFFERDNIWWSRNFWHIVIDVVYNYNGVTGYIPGYIIKFIRYYLWKYSIKVNLFEI